MKFSMVIVSAAFVLAGAMSMAEAGGYNSHHHYPSKGAELVETYSLAPLNSHNGGGCRGYNCGHQQEQYDLVAIPKSLYNADAPASHNQNKGAYGPYHSYAVRPAIYGGHGLYNYKGYARHQPAPLYRPVRSYGPAPACHGYNCGHNAAPAHYNRANRGQRAHYGSHKPQYGLRPVQTLVLTPVYSNNYNQAPQHYNNAGLYGHAAADVNAYLNNDYAHAPAKSHGAPRQAHHPAAY